MKDYKEILEGVMNIINTTEKSDIGFANICTYIGENCPELKENEDERIREELKFHFKQLKQQNFVAFTKDGPDVDAILAWVEKQREPIDEEKVQIGARKDVALSIMNFLDKNTRSTCLSSMECADLEDAVVNSDWSKVYGYMKKKLENQDEPTLKTTEEEEVDNTNEVEPKDYNSIDPYFGKPIDKVEPKFKVGDWIVNNKSKDVFFIKSINSGYCSLEDTKGNIYSPCLPFESDFHLWTIQDAKAGDILVCPNYIGDMPFIFIFKNIKRKDNDVFCYCSFFKIFMTGSYVASADPTDTDFYPATNEQRILLFVKMKEEGYMWLSDKRQLVELLFKEGDTVRKKLDGSIWHISYIDENGYWDHHNLLFPIENQNEFELVEPELTPSEVTKENDKLTVSMNESHNILLDKIMNWDEIRVQAAIAAMQGMLANATLVDDARLDYRITIEQAAVSYANTLVEELKKKE